MADSQVKSGNLLPPRQGIEIYGVKFTILPDGKVCVNGTPTQEYAFGITIPANISGDYYFSGCPSGGSYSTYDVFMYDKTAAARPKMWDGTTASLADFGDSADNQVKLVAGHETEFRIRVRQGYELRNVIFSPYLREPTSPPYYMPYSSTGWYHSLRKFTTATEAVENPLYSDGTAITSYAIKGNTVQNGTPTPSNPVVVNGVGEKTKNLLKNDAVSTEFRGVQYTVNADKSVTIYGTAGSQVSYFILMGDGAATNNISAFSTPIFKAGDSLIFSTGTWVSLEARYTNGTYYNNIPSNQVITLTKDVGLLFVQVSSGGTRNITVYPMITLSTETDTTYEPWGYKIPIPNGQQTTNIYLGSTQSTRQIKKLVLTGEESGLAYYGPFGTYNHKHFYIDLGGYTTIPMTNDILLCCNTYTATNNVNNIGNYCCRYQQSGSDGWNINRIYFTNDDYNSLDDVITALRNNPIILYIIATQETTGIVNEPLMKIGDYADTLSNATAIPTTEGANSITIDTTVQPSEFTATWTGWHNATVKEFNGTTWAGIVVTRQVDFANNTSPVVPSVADLTASSVYSGITRCNVSDDGTITAYYGDSGYTEDGSNGQVMVKIPKFWYKLDVSESGSLDGNNIRKGTWSIADAPADGFKLHPAFLAADGVTELDYFLYGAFDAVGQDSNGTYSTSYNTTSYKLGSVGGNSYKPSVSLTRATARTMATNRGTGWYSAGVKQTMAIQMLFAVEYGFNSQTTLGNGIVSASAASKTGTTTGSTSSGDLSGKTTAVNYRGIENFWGNVWTWIDGINFSDRTPYICNSYSFADDTSSGYTSISFNLPSSNYITALGYDSTNDWVLLPSESSSTSAASGPIGDYVSSSSSWCVALLGGRWSIDSIAGAFSWSCNIDSSYAAAYVGARVMFIP